MALTESKIIGDFDFTDTFLSYYANPFHFTSTFAILQEGDDCKIMFTFYNKVKRTFTKLYVNPYHKTDVGDNNKITYDCEMNEFGVNDTVYYEGERNISARFKARIFVDIDPYLITHDKAYFECLMKDVLDVDRVERYLDEGAKEVTSQPCGIYVGGATYYNSKDGKPQKGFNSEVGRYVHQWYSEILTEQKISNLRYFIKNLKEKNSLVREEIMQKYAEIKTNDFLINEKEKELIALEQRAQVSHQSHGNFSK